MKAYTDLEQSKKLAEILPLESASMIYMPIKGGFFKIPECYPFNEFKDSDTKPLPCWSLAELLKMLKDYQLFSNGLIVYIDNESYKIDSDNPVDACYEMIIKLHEMNLL